VPALWGHDAEAGALVLEAIASEIPLSHAGARVEARAPEPAVFLAFAKGGFATNLPREL
jgi:hypothetical protein